MDDMKKTLDGFGKIGDMQQEANRLTLLLNLTRMCCEFKITPAQAVKTFMSVGEELKRCQNQR